MAHIHHKVVVIPEHSMKERVRFDCSGFYKLWQWQQVCNVCSNFNEGERMLSGLIVPSIGSECALFHCPLKPRKCC